MAESGTSRERVEEWLSHVKALAEGIGPRGPTREGERRGAEYARDQLSRAGLAPRWESFKSARSIFHPHLLGGCIVLASFLLLLVGGRAGAAAAGILTVVVIVCELRELGFQPNLFRLLVPKGESQNVHAVIPPRGAHVRDLVLVGHVDTQRTPLVFRSRRWVAAFDKFTMAAFAGFLWMAVDCGLAAAFAWPWTLPAAAPAAACAALLAALCIQAEATPFTAGANDNASAVGLVLALARRFAEEPLESTRVWAVVTGCEEVQHYGMIDFYRRHRAALTAPRAIVFELVGCAGPSWSEREGIIVPFRSDPGLRRIAEQLSADHPEWGAYPSRLSGGNTEMADAARSRVPAIALAGLTREGVMPYWHQRADTADKMDPEVMRRTWEMAEALIRALDAGRADDGRD
jgi:hypothetical protein